MFDMLCKSDTFWFRWLFGSCPLTNQFSPQNFSGGRARATAASNSLGRDIEKILYSPTLVRTQVPWRRHVMATESPGVDSKQAHQSDFTPVFPRIPRCSCVLRTCGAAATKIENASFC